ncbi:cationic amino acid transporter 3-like [Acanthaster planci]|uniref:Cationic amino acid transporter 3-like n=1 Tax=Acanthaster planci TaxID=133434 RepID=A0A8B7XX31_ACAPL|nr:cationic amino acid transporter 3-like [Acanthaster planci]
MAEGGFYQRFRRSVTRKKVTDTDSNTTTLKRCLTSTDLALMGIGGMLGSGVYILTGEVGVLAGPAATLSFAIAGVVSLLTALLYTECATRVPRTGASYLFTYVGLGELAAFLVGWNVIIMRTFVVAYAARGWSAYFDNLLGNRIRNFTIEQLMHGEKWESAVLVDYPDLIGGAVTLLGTIPIAVGTDLSSKTNGFFVVVNVVTVAMVFVVSMVHAEFSYLTVHGFFPKGFGGVVAGAAVCLGSGYGGFESILFSAEEAKNPSRGLPIGIISAYVVSIINYLAGVVAISVLTDYHDINPLSPFVTAFDNIGLYWMGYVVGLGGLCSMTGGVLNTIFCLSRNIFAMARDGLLPALLGRTNEVTQTPIIATVFGGVLSILISVFVDFLYIIEFISLAALADYIIVAVAVISLRYQPSPMRSQYTPLVGADANESHAGEELTDMVSMPRNNDQDQQDPENYPSTSDTHSDKAPMLSTDPPGRGSSAKFFSAPRQWISENPTTSVLTSIAVHLAFEAITVSLVTYQMDDLLRLDTFTVAAVAFCGVVTIFSCFPLLVLPKYGEGIPFKVPLMPYLPLVSLLCNVILAVQIQFMAWVELIVWMLAGVVVYCAYGMDNSVEGKRK